MDQKDPEHFDHIEVNADFLPEGTPESYEALPAKTKALAKYAVDLGYQNLLKIDCDSYLRPELLRAPQGLYAGRLRGPSAIQYVPPGVRNVCNYVSGGAYWLRNVALKIIAEAPLTKDPAEDRWVGNTLNLHGIQPEGLPFWIAPTHVPVTDYLRDQRTVVCMQMEEPRQMRDVFAGKFDPPRSPVGSRPQDYPAGSLLRKQMERI